MKDWNFALPIASVILSACWPGEFPVYDYRVLELLIGFPELKNLSDFEKIRYGYNQYKAKVSEAAPTG